MAKKTTSGLPTRVKVGYRDYKIEEMASLEAFQKRRSGETRHITQQIAVNLTQGTREAAETLLHEIIHAVWWVWRIDGEIPDRKTEDHEEAMVCRASFGLATVWRDNPDVLAWIGHHLVHGT